MYIETHHHVVVNFFNNTRRKIIFIFLINNFQKIILVGCLYFYMVRRVLLDGSMDTFIWFDGYF